MQTPEDIAKEFTTAEPKLEEVEGSDDVAEKVSEPAGKASEHPDEPSPAAQDPQPPQNTSKQILDIPVLGTSTGAGLHPTAGLQTPPFGAGTHPTAGIQNTAPRTPESAQTTHHLLNSPHRSETLQSVGSVGSSPVFVSGMHQNNKTNS